MLLQTAIPLVCYVHRKSEMGDVKKVQTARKEEK